MSTCCELGELPPHRHHRTVCPACGELIQDVATVSAEEPPPAIRDLEVRVLGRHKRTCSGSMSTETR